MSQDSIVHIVDDNEAIRKSLTMLMLSAALKSKNYPSAASFIEQYTPGSPGCLLLDIRMPKMSGLELQQILPQHHINIPVIIMTGYADVPTAIRAMKAGAYDFVEKPFDQEDLINRIRACIESAQVQRPRQNYNDDIALLKTLTPREHEVLDLLVEGKINKSIAAELGISTRTVEAHRANLTEKLQAKSISDVIRIALLAAIGEH